MNLKVVLFVMFIIFCTSSVVVASNAIYEDAIDDGSDDVIHVHHRPGYMENFSENNPDFNVWCAMAEVVYSVI